MVATIPRKKFENDFDATVAQRAEEFIDGLPHGVGTWADGKTVHVPGVRGAHLRITDKVGGDQSGPLRHIELWQGDRLVVTFEYSHYRKRLVRTF